MIGRRCSSASRVPKSTAGFQKRPTSALPRKRKNSDSSKPNWRPQAPCPPKTATPRPHGKKRRRKKPPRSEKRLKPSRRSSRCTRGPRKLRRRSRKPVTTSRAPAPTPNARRPSKRNSLPRAGLSRSPTPPPSFCPPDKRWKNAAGKRRYSPPGATPRKRPSRRL